MILQELSFDIVYRPGKENAGPDALSRLPAIQVLQPRTLIQAQATDNYCQSVILSLPKANFSFDNNILLYKSKPVLPQCFWQQMFNVAHNIPIGGHLGYPKTLQRLSAKFWFPSITLWTKQQVQSCFPCQETKIRRRFLGHSTPTTAASEPFQRVAMDCFGPMPTSTQNNTMILVIQDIFSRYVIIVPIPSSQATHIAKALVDYLICEHGCPESFFSDNAFDNHVLHSLCNRLNITQQFAPAFHPSSNGLVERFMTSLRNMITIFMDKNRDHTNWDNHLQEFAFAYNSAVHSETGIAPFFLVHGHDARLPTDPPISHSPISYDDYSASVADHLLRAKHIVTQRNATSKQRNAHLSNSRRATPPFQLNDFVMLHSLTPCNASTRTSGKLTKSWIGPFKDPRSTS